MSSFFSIGAPITSVKFKQGDYVIIWSGLIFLFQDTLLFYRSAISSARVTHTSSSQLHHQPRTIYSRLYILCIRYIKKKPLLGDRHRSIYLIMIYTNKYTQTHIYIAMQALIILVYKQTTRKEHANNIMQRTQRWAIQVIRS